MTLQQANERLLKLMEQINSLTSVYQKAEEDYQRRFSQLVSQSGFGNQAQREAEAREAMRVEGSSESYFNLKVDMKILLTEKDILIEVSRNLRAIIQEQISKR